MKAKLFTAIGATVTGNKPDYVASAYSLVVRLLLLQFFCVCQMCQLVCSRADLSAAEA